MPRLTLLPWLVVLLSSCVEIWQGLEQRQFSYVFAAADTEMDEERWNDAWEEKEMLSQLFEAPKPPLSYRMSNGRDMPLIGLGVGNLPHNLIEEAIVDGIGEKGCYRVIDTASASENEHIVARAINSAKKKVAESIEEKRGLRKKNNNDYSSLNNDVIHVVTKIWYTHLGYERTKLSVQESIKNLQIDTAASNGNNGRQNILRVHLILHWPHCDPNISWMECEEEEARLPQHVKNAGPPPHLNPSAWKDSWRALEELYLEDRRQQRARQLHHNHTSSADTPSVQIESIGVSNFDLDEMKSLISIATVKPHMYQGSIWSSVHNPDLMTYLHHHNIMFQGYGVILSIINRRDEAPNAYQLLEIVGQQLASTLTSTDGTSNANQYEASQVVLAWLTNHDMSVVLRSSSSDHRYLNSPKTVGTIPKMSNAQQLLVTRAVKALLAGKDLPTAALNFRHSTNQPTIQALSGKDSTSRRVLTTFFNALTDPVQVFWSNTQTGEESLIAQFIEPGEVFEQFSHPGHTFVVYDSDRQKRKEFKVTKPYGEEEHFHVEL